MCDCKYRALYAKAAKERDEARAELKAYKGTGLSPERVEEIAKDEADGRLVVLPCKVGDSVWYIFDSEELCEAKVTGIHLSIYTNPPLWLNVEYHSKIVGTKDIVFRIDLELGKTVFLTREEAEAALERKKEES